MNRKKRYTVALLSGDGIGPELTAEASRVLAEVSRMHGFAVDELHLPFGGDAVRRFGHPLPPATRAACLDADAVLVASTREPALEDVKAELDLGWRLTRVSARGSQLAVVGPLRPDAAELALERAFGLALGRRASLTSVGESPAWRAALARVAERHEGVRVERARFEDAVVGLLHDPARFDVVVCEQPFGEALSGTAASAHGGTRLVASGRLGPGGKGVFGPTHGSAPQLAGQGVANPSAMLLAAALLLGEGLGERSAARTLEHAVLDALDTGLGTPDLVSSGTGATTREFADALLASLPSARRDTEFAGAAA
ncbi:MAG TPA: isocitrate/isopropylmalate family dehydrogenase [Gaiellaceae bacterium]|nr:isocitrate/isopropylmalate family dehydrogenase [Gaiellaceae bacterium]